MNIKQDINCNLIIQDEIFEEGYAHVYIVQLNKADESTMSKIFIRENAEQDIVIPLQYDGFYTIGKLKVPINPQNEYFYKNDTFYHGAEKINLDELIQIIDLDYEYFFATCKLKKCLFNASYKIISDRTSIRCNNNGVSKYDIYRRDLLWSAMNSIKYLVELEQYREAERLLERITGCN